MYKFLFIFFVIAIAGFFYKYFEQNYLAKTVVARVTLKTNCELEAKAFAVKNLTSGEIREFQHGEAFIKATLADELKIVLSEKFDQILFDGEVVQVKSRLEIFQDCEKPVCLEGIFKSFNEQFAAK